MTLHEKWLVLAHEARRVTQTPRAFTNWTSVLSDMARERVGRGPDTLRFATRTGLRIDTPNRPGARVPIYEIFAEDCYRLAWFLGPLIHEPIQVLDVGAHVGTFSCRLAQVHGRANIQSFEPSPTTVEFLRRNVEQNGFAERITAFEQALAGQSGYAVFDDNGGGSGTNGLAGAGHSVPEGQGTKVQTVTFDEVVAAAPAPIDLVKLDCEGGEYDLVYNSSPGNWTSVRRLVLEYHKVGGQSWRELREWFAGVGLTVVRDEPVTAELGTAWLSREALAPGAR
ncbi:MAG: hypothetical protein JWO57_848 [Pseudonocardiales bacterium]|nr:hypothetical protein [Pseudonocardiales bacterium]